MELPNWCQQTPRLFKTHASDIASIAKTNDEMLTHVAHGDFAALDYEMFTHRSNKIEKYLLASNVMSTC